MTLLSFEDQYNRLLKAALGHGVAEENKRTGHEVKVIRGGAYLILDLRNNKIPICGGRKMFPKSAAAEVAWYILGKRDISFIRKYAPLWEKFTEDDGQTVASAYGYRWRHHFGRDQLYDAVMSLLKDPTDRQIIVMAWDPGSDALGSEAKKNVPCPLFFQLYSLPTGKACREIYMSVYMRSSDIFIGLPYDVMGHALLLWSIVDECNMSDSFYHGLRPSVIWRIGSLQFTLAHAHLYDSHYEMAKQMLESQELTIEPRVPTEWPMSKIYQFPDHYVANVGRIQDNMNQPALNFKPEVIE